MKISDITSYLDCLAPSSLQESYDNAGLLTGDNDTECHGVICCLDAVEDVIDEAIEKNCNLVVAHHPIIFSGLKKITGKTYVERTIIKAIKNDIAIYAIHTNLDNIITGVNGMVASKLGLKNLDILSSKTNQLQKLYFYVPASHAENVMDALFKAGGGNIGNYSECSFSVNGRGTFKPNEAANPFSGQQGLRSEDDELKMEILFPAWLQNKMISALKSSHPYEEVAYEVISLENRHQEIGSGLIGELATPAEETAFLEKLKEIFGLKLIKHTSLRGKPIKKVAVCGGAGSFLIGDAIASQSDIYITSDVKYHEFFDADGKLVLADIGHFESEQFTIHLLAEFLEKKFRNFAVLKTGVNTNPVHYFL
ncbi:MAG: Nif3-like dinuclear metal center hexameric protein [Sphingobacteriales bacterium]|jgi:dinuclear metal center YbgI/SA1388 family protein|nr:Nif3-like dinuclear metal center hexameric protein [Sphingobacteriales bacterium]